MLGGGLSYMILLYNAVLGVDMIHVAGLVEPIECVSRLEVHLRSGRVL